jgi:hypothetical protein
MTHSGSAFTVQGLNCNQVAMKRSLRSWLWRVEITQEVDEEITVHIEMRTRELVERGMDPRAAGDSCSRAWAIAAA